jgi:LemA protein
MLKKPWVIILSIVGILVLMGGCTAVVVGGKYNQMVTLDEGVEKMVGDLNSAYQRRADLIPNLVNTVKGYADFEQQTLTQVIEARSKATAVQLDANNLSPEKVAQFQEAQQGLSSALSRLLVTVERYPDLKANQNFLQLQAQLEGTENRINVERRKFNEAVQGYNAYIRKFPNSIFSGIFGFERKGYFEGQAGIENAPEVKF